MIFKQKLKKFLVRAPIIIALTLACLTSVPTQTNAAESKTTLWGKMPYFVKIGDYDIIETTGENLNSMFDMKVGKQKELNPDRQYIAYYKIDRKKTGTMGWHTEYEYCILSHGIPTNITMVNQFLMYLHQMQLQSKGLIIFLVIR